MHDSGRTEKETVQTVVGTHGLNDRTVRRCIVGLDLVKAGEAPSDDVRDRFERLGGTDHYLHDLRRDYWSHSHPDGVTEVGFKTSSIKRLEIIDEVVGEGHAGSYDVYVDLDLVTTRPVRLDGVAIVASGQHVTGELILQDDRMNETGTYLARFNLPADTCLEDCDAHVVMYVNGQEFHTPHTRHLSESPGSPPCGNAL